MQNFLFRYAAILFSILLSGCSNPQILQERPIFESFPLHIGQPNGAIIKQCVKFNDSGEPTFTTCPSAIQSVMVETKTYPTIPSKEFISHTWGVNQFGGKFFLPSHQLGGGAGFTLADETLVYDVTKVTKWADKVSESDLVALMNICTNRSAAFFDAIVTEEDSGCSVVKKVTNANAGIPKISMEFLHNSGTTIGTPKDFWSNDPELKIAPSTISCTTKQPVKVQVMSIDGFCTTFVNSMYLRKLTTELETLRNQLNGIYGQPSRQAQANIANVVEKLDETKNKIESINVKENLPPVPSVP